MVSRKDSERLLEIISKGGNSISMMFRSICRPSDTLNTVNTYVTTLGLPFLSSRVLSKIPTTVCLVFWFVQVSSNSSVAMAGRRGLFPMLFRFLSQESLDHCQIWVADMLSVYRRLLGTFPLMLV